jgi:hypothetical protein
MERAIFPLVCAVILLTSCSGGLTKKLVFTRDEIQAKVERKFPIEKMTLGMLKVIVTSPDTILVPTSDKIGLKAEVAVKPPDIGNIFGGGGEPYKGVVQIEGDVDYVPAEGRFYFTNGSVKDLEVAALPAEYKEPVLTLINEAARENLAKVELMTLNEADLKERAAKYLLKSVKVKSGKLEVVIGLGGS